MLNVHFIVLLILIYLLYFRWILETQTKARLILFCMTNLQSVVPAVTAGKVCVTAHFAYKSVPQSNCVVIAAKERIAAENVRLQIGILLAKDKAIRIGASMNAARKTWIGTFATFPEKVLGS